MLISEPASRRKPRLPLFQAADLLDPLPEPLGGDVVAEAVAGRVVGDRHVGVAARAARLRPSPRACCGRRRASCGSAGRRGCRRARSGPAACPRAPPSARRGPRAAPARCRRSRAARRPPPRSRRASTSPLSVSVIPCSETERPRATASSRSCTLWALEPVKCCSRLPKAAGGDDPQVDRDAVVGLRADAVGAGGAGGGDQRVVGEVLGERRRAPRRWRSGRCPCRSRPSAGPSRRPRPGWRAGCSRSAAASSSAIGRTFESSSRPRPGSPVLAEPLERGEHVLLDLRRRAP